MQIDNNKIIKAVHRHWYNQYHVRAVLYIDNDHKYRIYAYAKHRNGDFIELLNKQRTSLPNAKKLFNKFVKNLRRKSYYVDHQNKMIFCFNSAGDEVLLYLSPRALYQKYLDYKQNEKRFWRFLRNLYLRENINYANLEALRM